MDGTKREKVIDIAILVVMGLVLLMPIGFAIAASGMFGKIMLLGKSEFSPWMDRLLLLGTAFWLMYLWSWFVPEVKNRAPKVFGCVALFAICSIVAIQFDNMLIPNFADTAARDAANVWFFNLPYYALRAFDTGMVYSKMSFVVMGIMLVASGGLLWWIKTEIAIVWKKALLVWGMYEVTLFIFLWIIYRIFGPIMFKPQSVVL